MALATTATITGENPIFGDLRLVLGDFVWLDDSSPDAIAQRIQQRLLSFRGEWYLDQRLGFPWFQKVIGVKGPVPSRVRSYVRQTIEGTLGVKDVLEISFALNFRTRLLTMEWSAKFDDGKVYTSADFDVPFILEIR